MKTGECVSSCITFLLLRMSPLSTVKLFCDCLSGGRTNYYFCILALFSH